MEIFSNCNRQDFTFLLNLNTSQWHAQVTFYKTCMLRLWHGRWWLRSHAAPTIRGVYEQLGWSSDHDLSSQTVWRTNLWVHHIQKDKHSQDMYAYESRLKWIHCICVTVCIRFKDRWSSAAGQTRRRLDLSVDHFGQLANGLSRLHGQSKA